MESKDIIKIGDICTYSYQDSKNKSLCIVKVVKELSEEIFVVEFLQVIVDDSGNDFFNYLHYSAKTMNVSKKYLHKIDIVNQQQAEIERLQSCIDDLDCKLSMANDCIAETNKQRGAVIHAITRIDEVKTEAYKEFEKRVIENICAYYKDEQCVSVGTIKGFIYISSKELTERKED